MCDRNVRLVYDIEDFWGVYAVWFVVDKSGYWLSFLWIQAENYCTIQYIHLYFLQEMYFLQNKVVTKKRRRLPFFTVNYLPIGDVQGFKKSVSISQ